MRTLNPYRAAGMFDGISYIEREADKQLLLAIETNQRYPYLLAPRQSGKSSLLLHIMRALDPCIYRCVFVDLSIFPQEVLQDYDAFLSQFSAVCMQGLHIAESTLTASTLSSILKALLGSAKERIVIFIDEIDVLLTVDFKDLFFSQVRSAFNVRDMEPELGLARVQFVLSGTALQTQLISDPLRSPFNVGGPITLSDLTLEQVAKMAHHLKERGASLTPRIENAIYQNTSGSIYLTQLVLENLWERYIAHPHRKISLIDIDAVVDKIVTEANDNVHFTHIYNVIAGDLLLRKAFANWMEELPVDKAAYESLRLTGILGDDHLFRNAIYERVFGPNGPLEVQRGRRISEIMRYPPEALSNISLVGMEQMRRAVRNILEHQVKTDSCMTLLLFGWPGSAKSSIIPTVVAELRSEGQFWHYVYVPCHRLLFLDLDQAMEVFVEIDRMLSNQPAPMVVVLDELDAISPYRVGGAVLNRLTAMVDDVFQRRWSYRQKVLCGVTANPNLIDPAVRDHCEIPLYFELPDDRMLIEILKREGPMDEGLASQVVGYLQSRATRAWARYSGRALANGCRKVKELLEKPWFEGREPADVAEDIASYADQISQQEIENWERENANYLARARTQLRHWAARDRRAREA